MKTPHEIALGRLAWHSRWFGVFAIESEVDQTFDLPCWDELDAETQDEIISIAKELYDHYLGKTNARELTRPSRVAVRQDIEVVERGSTVIGYQA